MKDKDYMDRAFSLAKKGQNATGSNPMVGAVLVRNNKIIGEGYHESFGGPHAEVNAITNAESKGRKVSGSTLYVTLEPCSHKDKKTPPCTDLLIKKKIKQVIFGSLDPNPKVNGNSIQILKKNKIRTKYLDNELKNFKINRGFKKLITSKIPFVTLKICMSLDGMIFDLNSKNNSIGDSDQLRHSNALRKDFESILIGVGTVLVDDPKLTYRGKQVITQPRPIILDSNLRTPIDSNIVKLRNKPLILTKKEPKNRKFKLLDSSGCNLVSMKELTPKRVLRQSGKANIKKVLIEGGGKVFTSFLSSNLWDELVIYYSPKFLGNSGMLLTEQLNKNYLIKDRKCTTKKIGESIMLVFT